MGKTRSERLTIVAEVIEQSVLEAAQALERANQVLQQEQDKLVAVRAYYAEYSSQPTSALKHVGQLSRQSAFLSQIYVAQEQQKNRVQQQEDLVEQLRQRWQKLHLQHKAIQEFVVKVVNEENMKFTRKEEKLLDDWFIQTQHLRQGDNPHI